MRIHSTLGRSTSELVPRDGAVGVYMCGPTVQAVPHLGHGRAFVVFDVLCRYLRWRGLDVTYVRNITDVDDKIIAAAAERGVPFEQHAREMEQAFADAMAALCVEPPDVEPRATEHIPQMLELIGLLIDRGHAYAAGGDVYFSVRSHPDYGKLSGRNIDELLSGARVEPGAAKRDPLDFALWKGAKPGEPSWESPWGPGRPGWHIECSAMARTYLGDDFDIHGGGTDLIFPHHENEIAQSEAATGRPFARHWMHNGMLNLGGEKMSKSTGHVIDLVEAAESYPAAALRLFYLRAHYRSPLEYSLELLDESVAAWERLRAFRRRAGDAGEADTAYLARFVDAMEDDLATPEAISTLFDLVREGNRRLGTGEPVAGLAGAYDVMASVLGLAEATDGGELPSGIEEVLQRLGLVAEDLDTAMDLLIEARAGARAERDWATADDIRDRVAGAGITLEDTADGVRWYRS
jgi:cysteinyl-tRNA synthetase